MNGTIYEPKLTVKFIKDTEQKHFWIFSFYAWYHATGKDSFPGGFDRNNKILFIHA